MKLFLTFLFCYANTPIQNHSLGYVFSNAITRQSSPLTIWQNPFIHDVDFYSRLCKVFYGESWSGFKYKFFFLLKIFNHVIFLPNGIVTQFPQISKCNYVPYSYVCLNFSTIFYRICFLFFATTNYCCFYFKCIHPSSNVGGAFDALYLDNKSLVHDALLNDLCE